MLPPKVPSAASTGNSSITSGTSSGAITTSLSDRVANANAADRLAVPFLVDVGLDLGAGATQNLEQRACASDSGRRPRW